MTSREKQTIIEYKRAIKAANAWTRQEIKKYNAPNLWAYNSSNLGGQKIAAHYKVNKNLILLGTILEDISLGRAKASGKIKQHSKMCHEDAKKFLTQFNLPTEDKKKILEGILLHHQNKGFHSLEAEIITNADSYKFLSLKNTKLFLQTLLKEKMTPTDALNFVKFKFNEKLTNLTLPFCKKDLKSEIQKIEKFLNNFH